MRHQQNGSPRAASLHLQSQPPQHILHLRACQRIERAERLIHQQDVLACGQRPRQSDSLPLPARQFMRHPPRKIRRIQPHHFKQHVRTFGNRRARSAFNLQHQPDVALHRKVREEPGLLDHIADRTAQRDDLLLEDRAPTHQHIAAADAMHAVDRSQQCRLPGSALPQQRHGGAHRHLQRHIVQQRAAIWQTVAHIAELDGGHGTHALLQKPIQKRKAGTRPGLIARKYRRNYSSPSSSPSSIVIQLQVRERSSRSPASAPAGPSRGPP